ncbi:hypothetical protein Kirov_250 [Bacillus phage Kirov]|uniref:Uncharacterized protein n=1 Tax=Bacillus phage Kirov TaxID=2783539 RepID=A0A7U3RYD4_9CAUD|nr:hypothetical protein PQE67_gp054 [Bacillus phage Kirov]QOV08449.1 hypothetical protein Kirov_250 [Bacillus phage Kirov]
MNLQPITMKAIEEKYGSYAKKAINRSKKWVKAESKVFEKQTEFSERYPQAYLIYKSTTDKYVIYNTVTNEANTYDADLIKAIIGEVK